MFPFYSTEIMVEFLEKNSLEVVSPDLGAGMQQEVPV
jgi:predicted thioesterase